MSAASMSGQVRLGSLGTFRNGVNFKRDDKGEGIRLINVKDIFKSGRTINFESLDRVALGERTGIEKYYVKTGDLFFVRSSVKRDGVGLVSMAPRDDHEIVHCGFIIRFRVTNRDADPLFLTYLLRAPVYRKTIIGVSSGAAITNISQDSLASLSIDLPPISIQRQVVGVLSAYDDLIENSTRRITVLEEMARSIYREWFVHFRFPGHEEIKLVDSHVGKIPEGWEVKKLSEVAAVNESSIKKGDEPSEIKYVDIASVSKGQILQTENLPFKEAPGRARRKVKHGDIVWSAVRPNLRAYALILDPAPNLIVSTGFAVISPKLVLYSYLYETLTADKFVEYLVNHTRGAAYPAVNTEDFENAKILVPDTRILDSYHDIVNDFFILRHSFLEKNANLRRTRDLLLPRLVSGEIDVSQLKIETEEYAKNE